MEANYACTSEVFCIIRIVSAECSFTSCSLACLQRVVFLVCLKKNEARFTASSKNKFIEMVTYKVGHAPALRQ